MRLHGLFSLLALLIMAASSAGHAQGFGKNKVQYFSQDWSYLQSEHFDVFFYQDGYTIAEFVADAAEEAYLEISHSFNYSLRDRVTIITYKSHNDFQGTNVTFSTPEEGVGGFTEFFKNRVVIPYEGSYEQLRHVTHHELTHAIMLEMVYGGGLGSIIASLSRMPMPDWFAEGLAEYESRHGWDTDSDVFMRDATINGYVPEIEELYGFMAYKGGQSLLYYISERYGQEKIAELLSKIKTARDVERGFKLALGLDYEELTKRWHQWLKRNYWPSVADLQDPEDLAKRLTDHRKKGNFVNSSPALSPQGDQIAFLSDRSDYFDIYLVSVVDGKIKRKLLSGQTSAKFEELHWLRPGLSWSPDGKDLAFAAKAGKSDALHILDVEKANVIRTLRFDLDGVFSPTYSPDGRKIAFVGLKNGHSDIYAVDLASDSLEMITDDIFSDMDPSWSPDGRYVAFTSDRGDHLEALPADIEFRVAEFNYHQADVYIADLETGGLRRLTATPYNERTPEWTPQEDILSYVSDRDGVYNLYLHTLENDELHAITNLLTGCFQPTWSNTGGLAFSSFFDAGYDIFYVRDPFDPGLKRAAPEAAPDTAAAQRTSLKEAHKKDETESLGLQETSERPTTGRMIFDNRYRGEEETEKVFLDSSEYLTDAGRYKVNQYKVSFSPDIVYATAGYSTFFGLQAMGLVLFSDMLGDHQIFLGLDIYSDLENTNAQFIYLRLPKRLDYGFGLRHNVYFFYIRNEAEDTYEYFRDRNYGLTLYGEYPFSRFSRLEGSLDLVGIDRETYNPIFDQYHYTEKRRLAMPGLAYVHDTILWGSTGPINGTRYRLSVTASPDLEDYLDIPGSDGWGLDFQMMTLDARRYFKVTEGYTIALRGTAGFSEGGDPVRFFVGGESNWINRRYQGEIEGSIEDIYFSSFITPFRGGDYYAAQGTRFALVNAEFRYPLIRHLVLGFPLPVHIRNIRGAMFLDTAGAWEKDHFRGVIQTPEGDARLNDLMMGYGLGARLNLGIFLLRWDVAWRTYLNQTDKPRYYFSLGAEF
jgi:Tol biopolymer transport system component